MKTKSNIAMMALSSVICLLPVILSLVLYHDLPEEVAIHWNIAGNPNMFAPKAVAAFGLPFFLAVVNVISRLFLYNDPKRQNISKAIRMISEWIVPFVSLIFVPVTLFIAMGASIPIFMVAMVFVGIVLILIGNYLPKSRQNYVVGIKLPWTLNNADNWNKTHRMAGYLFIFAGVVSIIVSFVSSGGPILLAVILSLLALLIIVPVFYSFSLYKKGEQDSETESKFE
jgi:uncharacterized membrane protein